MVTACGEGAQLDTLDLRRDTLDLYAIYAGATRDDWSFKA
jgi:hypothetical protein